MEQHEKSLTQLHAMTKGTPGPEREEEATLSRDSEVERIPGAPAKQVQGGRQLLEGPGLGTPRPLRSLSHRPVCQLVWIPAHTGPAQQAQDQSLGERRLSRCPAQNSLPLGQALGQDCISRELFPRPAHK